MAVLGLQKSLVVCPSLNLPSRSKRSQVLISKTDDWPIDEDIVKAIEANFNGDWGDRRQELVFIGESVNQEAVHDAFNHCLLTDAEMKRWGRMMRNGKCSSEEIEDKLNEMFEGMFSNQVDVRRIMLMITGKMDLRIGGVLL